MLKKTKVMLMNGAGQNDGVVALDGVPLEKVTRFKYLGSWITDDARDEDDISARVGMAKAAFGKIKK